MPFSFAWAAAVCCQARPWPRARCRPGASSTASSRLPATTASSRFAAAPSCTSTPPPPSPIAPPRTIADGAQTQHLGQITFPIIRRDVDDILTVTDEQLIDAMRFFAERMKLIVEPTGCLGFAAAHALRSQLAGQRVGVLISGGNIDMARFCALLAP